MFAICSNSAMQPESDMLHASVIADAILNAPGWARIGITAPSERLRLEAAQELALAVRHELIHEAGSTADQMRLPL
jgi:hypothetical protein